MAALSGAQRIVGIGVTLAVAYILLLGGAAAGMVHPEIRIASLAIATLALGAWVVVAWTRPEWRPRSVFLPVFGLALAALAISTAASRSPRVGLESIAQAVILASSYLLLVELLRRPRFRDRILFVTAAVGVLISVAYIGETLLRWSVFWSIVGRITTPPLRPDYASLIYGNPSPLLAMVVLLGTSIAAACPANRQGAIFGAVVAGLALVAALMSGTRAGWLGIAAAFLVFALVLVTRARPRVLLASARRALGGWRLAGAGVGIVGLVAVAILILGPGLLRRIDAGGDEVRGSFYLASARMFVDSPAFGVGPGLWPFGRAMNTGAGEVDYSVAAAHNVYLHTLAETGLLGMAVGIVLAVMVLWLLRDGLLSDSSNRLRWAFAAVFATTYFAIHELLDFHAGTPAVLLAAVMPIAILDATVERPAPFRASEARRMRQWLGFGRHIVVLAVFACAWWTTPATTLANNAVRAGNQGDWKSADALAVQARTWDPSLPEYWLLEGLTAAHVGDDERALISLRSFAEFSDMPEAWVDVAALELRNGNAADARAAISRAARLGLQHAALGVAISSLAQQLGDPAMAIEAGAAAVSRVPSLIADPWWTGDEARARLFEQMLAKSLELASPDARWEIQLMAGRTEAATAAAVTAGDPSLALDVIHAWDGDAEAGSHVIERCVDEPLDGPIAWCARVAYHLGRTDEGQRFQRLADMLRIPPDQVHELRIFEALTAQSTAGDISSKAGGSWRNLTLWDVLVPGVLRVAPALPET